MSTRMNLSLMPVDCDRMIREVLAKSNKRRAMRGFGAWLLCSKCSLSVFLDSGVADDLWLPKTHPPVNYAAFLT